MRACALQAVHVQQCIATTSPCVWHACERRFYEPQSGGIFLAGQHASEFSRGEWSKAVAMVGQEWAIHGAGLCCL